MVKKIQITELDVDRLKTILHEAVRNAIEFQSSREEPDRTQVQRPLSRKEAAQKLGICLTTLWSYDKSGILPARRRGTRVFYLEEDIKQYLSGRKVGKEGCHED